MSKTVVAHQQAAMYAGGHQVSRFLSFAWPGGSTVYWSERGVGEINPDAGKTFVPILLSFPQHSRSADLSIAPALPSMRAQFTALIDQAAVLRIDTTIAATNPVGAVVTTYCVLYEASLTSTDWITLGKWQVEDYEISYVGGMASVTFNLIDHTQQRGDWEGWWREITTEHFPNAPTESYGLVVPHIFGAIPDAPGILIDSGARATLTGNLALAETGSLRILMIDKPFASGPAAYVIIDNEIISYNSLRIVGDRTLDLVGLGRGLFGTAKSEHSNGAAVLQSRSSYRYVIADHACTTNGITNIRIKGALLESTWYTVGTESIGGRTVQKVTVTQFPVLRESNPVIVKRDLAEMDTAIVWGIDTSDNNVDSPLNATDAGATKHTTYAEIRADDATENTLHVKQTNSLAALTGTVKAARLLLEYQSIRRLGENNVLSTWPTGVNAPTVQVFAGTTALTAEVALSDPGDDDLTSNLYPDGDTELATSELFKVQGGEGEEALDGLLLGEEMHLVFASISGPIDISWGEQPTVAAGSAETWASTRAQTPTDGATLRFNESQVVTVAGADLVFPVGLLSLDYMSVNVNAHVFDTFKIPDLVLRVDETMLANDNVRYTKISTRIRLTGAGAYKVFGLMSGASVARIEFEGDGFSRVSRNVSLGDSETREETLSIEGDFTVATIRSLRVTVSGPGASSTNAARFSLDSVRIFGTQLQKLIGRDTELLEDGAVPSSRVTQEVTLTGVADWDWFDGTGAAYPNVRVRVPDSGNATRIRIYDVAFEADHSETELHPVTEYDAPLVCDVLGYVGDGVPAEGESQYIVGWEVIQRLLDVAVDTDGVYYGLTTADYDLTTLASAIALANPGGLKWRFDRRITERQPLRDLLASAIRESGIRACTEEGMIKFWHSLAGDQASIATINKNLLEVSAPVTKKATTIQLVANQIAVNYHKMLVSGDYSRSVTRNNTLAQSTLGEIRRNTVPLEWIRVEDIAEALAELFVQDFAYPLQVIQLTAYGPKRLTQAQPSPQDLEIGDVVTLTDTSYSVLSGRARVVGVSYPSASLARLSLINLSTATLVWAATDTTYYIEATPLRDQMDFYVAGTLVARLTGSVLSLLGEYQEGLAGVTMAADIEKITSPTNGIAIAVPPTAGRYQGVVFQVADANGVTMKAGSIYEKAFTYSAAATAHIQLGATYTMLSPTLDGTWDMIIRGWGAGAARHGRINIKEVRNNAL